MHVLHLRFFLDLSYLAIDIPELALGVVAFLQHLEGRPVYGAAHAIQ
jgi:hypothetical protein